MSFEQSSRIQSIHRQQLEHALIPFYSTKVNGSGIGLTLCRDIVEAHGGSINLRNQPEGLEVKLLLKLPS
nr:ATP-binding protein [Idiomarina rhizosphaerae]